LRLHGFGSGRFRCYRSRARKVSHLQDNLESLDFNLSVEQVEALDEASSIEPAQRNKTMTRALAYGGARVSVIA
jgi:diketogulonate reductase-like aldo/keto reductase